MKDIILSTAIILAIGATAAVLDHVFMSPTGQSAALAIHKLISPAAYLLHSLPRISVTWA